MLEINDSDVSGKSADFVVGVLRSIAPGASVSVEVERQSAQTSVTVICENSRPIIETILAGLDAAARGKFEECVSAFGRRGDFGALGAGMRVQCAELTKKPNQVSLAHMGVDALREIIGEAHWACANSIKLLPPAPPEFSASPPSASGGGSIADELKKLVDLKESGALTEAEFQAAKQRLLTAPSQP